MQISINPVLQTNAAGSFNVTASGYVQGTMMDDPSVRNALAGGVLATTETVPMWGGVAISELVPGAAGTPSTTLGTIVSRALTMTAQAAGQITGFSVFNQAHAMVNSPQSPVPLATPGMSVNFFRLGSGARLALAIDPALVTLDGQLITSRVSWDFVNQKIIAYDAGIGALPVLVFDVQIGNSMTVSYDAVTGFATWTRTGSAAIVQI